MTLKPRFPEEPHRRRAADDSLTAKKPQASNVIRLEIERERENGNRERKGKKGERGWVLSATSAKPISSARSHSRSCLGSSADPAPYATLWRVWKTELQVLEVY